MDKPADVLLAQGHEPIETNVRPIWWTAVVISGVVLLSFVLILGLMKWFAALEGRPSANYAAKTGTDWNEQRPLQQLRSQEHDLLDNYEWINSAAGVARIPVERAIEIISQNGLPAALNVPAATDASSTQEPISAGNNSATAEENEP